MSFTRPRIIKKLFFWTLAALAVCLLVVFICNRYVDSYSSGFIKDDIAGIPRIRVGLLPGTSKYFAKNDRNTFYQARVNAAFLLYKFKKIDRIIVSGTSEKFYNEPKQLKEDLRKLGIPDSSIICDSSGVHTLESIQFLKRLNTDSVIIISQYDHLQRAVFLARKSGINAFGYTAPDPIEAHRKVLMREYFAKVKAVWDSWTKF